MQQSRKPPSSEKPPLWTLQFTSMFCSRMVVNITFNMMGTTLVMIVYDIYHATAAMAGVVLGAYAFGMIAGRILFARFTDVVGRKRYLIITCIATAIAVATYFLAIPIEAFIVLRFVHGMGMGALTNAQTTVGIATIPRSRFSEGVSYFTLSVTISTAIGPFLGYLIMRYASAELFYAVCLACTIAALVIILLTPITEIQLSAEERAKLTQGIRFDQVFEKKAIPISLTAGMLSNACYVIITNFLASFAAEAGFYDFASSYFLIYAAFVVVFRPLTGRIMDVRGDNVIMVPAMLAFAVGLVLLSFCGNVFMLAVAAIINAFGQACTFSAGQAIASRDVEPHRLSLANSTYYTIADIGYGAGPALFGLIVPALGYSGMYQCAAVVMVVTTVAYWLSHGRYQVKSDR